MFTDSSVNCYIIRNILHIFVNFTPYNGILMTTDFGITAIIDEVR